MLCSFFDGIDLIGFSKGGGDFMADLYTALIIKGRKTINDVPEKFKGTVLENLMAVDVDGYGNPL